MAQDRVVVESLLDPGDADWLRMRGLLWPDAPVQEHRAEMAGAVAQPARFVQFMARDEARRGVGFVEASLRSDHVNGTESSPVAFLEGLWVDPGQRRRGVARALVLAAEAWARRMGCTELASDTPVTNRRSQEVHRRLGFEETERVVCFRRLL